MSWKYILEGCRQSAFPGSVLGFPAAGTELASAAVSLESVRGRGRGRIRFGLGHRPYRLAHRTPVLYSRNQSRTNIAPLKKLTREGVSLPSCLICSM